MIGVPLQGGKTLNVTFRSLNTRGDVFKSYNQTANSSSPISKFKSNEGLRVHPYAATSAMNSPGSSRSRGGAYHSPRSDDELDDQGLYIGE